MSAAASIEDLTRQYQAELSRLARQHYTNAGLRQDWLDHTIPRLAEQSRQAWKTNSARLVEWAEGALSAPHALNIISAASLFYDYLKDVRGLLHANPFACFISECKSDHRE